MRTVLIWSVLTMAASLPVAAQPADSAFNYDVLTRGGHHRVLERVEYEPAPDGREVPRKVRYTELATGLHYKNEQGAWVESKEEIEILPNGAGATARQGQHKVYLAPDVAAAETIDFETPDGKRLRSRILGLSYFDAASGESVMLGALKNSEGQLVAPNRVVYPDAFDEVLADVEYIYRLASFEQNIVLREQLPSPAAFGLNPQTTRLQVMTEFFNPPAPGTIADRRNSGVTDTVLDFGEMKIGRGRAFSVGENADGQQASVIKHWVQLESRSFLVEEVQLTDVERQLNALPARPGQASTNPSRRGQGENVIVALKAILPKPTAKTATVRMRMAKANEYRPNGFVLDYTITLSSTTDFTFKSDTTHYVSGTVNLSGVTTFEGGAIIKYAVSSSATITATNTVWQTDQYLPVIFTSKNDNSVGETISGSTGNPTTAYAGHIGLDLTAAPASCVISNARFCYLSNAIAGTDITLDNAQMIRCMNGFAANENGYSWPTLRNVLIYRVNTFVASDDNPGDTIIAENATAHYCTNFVDDTTGSIALTNCLFVSVTNWQSSTTITNSSVFLNSDAGVFQTVNGGAHYLATNSIYRNVGNSNINAGLLSGLRRRTTYPPIAFTNLTSTYTALGPQAQRDTDTPDLGYHYDPLDYIFGKVDQNTDLTFAAGTAVGWFRYNQGWTHAGHGIHIADTKTLSFAGNVTSPCWFVHQTAVQETLVGYTPIDAGPGGITGWATTKANQPYLNLQFTKFAGLPIYRNHIRDDSGALFVRANHCEFFGGGLGGYVSSLAFTTCLLDRTGTWLSAGNTNYNEIFVFRNCTVRGGYFVIDRQSGNLGHVKVTILDTVFDELDPDTDDPHNGTASLTHYNYNAFESGVDPTEPTGANDVTVTNFIWQSSWLGRFYIPTNSPLINVGSVTNAGLVGLYHFTMTTNFVNGLQIKETNSIVDIGYHYVAVSTNGLPIDTDGDGVPDYEEDSNGNGDVDSGETNWEDADDAGFRVFITRPKNNSVIP